MRTNTIRFAEAEACLCAPKQSQSESPLLDLRRRRDFWQIPVGRDEDVTAVNHPFQKPHIERCLTREVRRANRMAHLLSSFKMTLCFLKVPTSCMHLINDGWRCPYFNFMFTVSTCLFFLITTCLGLLCLRLSLLFSLYSFPLLLPLFPPGFQRDSSSFFLLKETFFSCRCANLGVSAQGFCPSKVPRDNFIL